jgi:dihydropteroate synthase
MLLDYNKINIMGILNVTPDSFSDGGEYYQNLDKIYHHVEEMIHGGADIIDIGGESSRPFSNPVSLDEELARIIPIIEKINEHFDIIISVDTYKAAVAKEALSKGAKIINDISGFTFDPKMVKTVAKYKPVCVVMHIKGTPKNMQENPVYENVTQEIFDFLKKQTEILKTHSIEEVIIDPGFGFGKTLKDNYILLKNLSHFKQLGCPILAGISRKSMIGKVIDAPPKERLAGTIALNTLAILNGASLLRVHDVKEAFQAVKVIEKYLEENI